MRTYLNEHSNYQMERLSKLKNLISVHFCIEVPYHLRDKIKQQNLYPCDDCDYISEYTIPK